MSFLMVFEQFNTQTYGWINLEKYYMFLSICSQYIPILFMKQKVIISVINWMKTQARTKIYEKNR